MKAVMVAFTALVVGIIVAPYAADTVVNSADAVLFASIAVFGGAGYSILNRTREQ